MTAMQAERSSVLGVGDAQQVARGLEVERRRAQLGMSKSALARRAHLDRATLSRIITGEDGVRETSLVAAERVLDELDEAMSEAVPAEPEAGVMRIEVRGIRGVEAMTVEAPVENLDQLEEMVQRILRRLDGNDDGS